MSKRRQDKLVGSLLSLPTFTDEDHSLRLDRQRIHLDWIIENGFTEGNGVLLIAGGLGEGAFLRDSEWQTLAELTVEVADGRVPTAAGVTELSARDAADKARLAADLGMDFIQLTPPHYMGPTDDDVFGFFKYVNDAADIGIIAYNLPWCMPNAFEFRQDIFEKFVDLENVDGLKWGSFSLFHWAGMIRLFKDRFNFIEQGGMLSMGYRLGMVGFIDTLGNVAPRYSLKRWELIREKRFDELDRLDLARFDAELNAARKPKVAVEGAQVQKGANASYPGMGEGPPARTRLSALGMDTGPYFPHQEAVSEAFKQGVIDSIEASGFMEWVDWDQSIFDQVAAPVGAG